MQCADVVHHRRSDDHQRTDHQGAVHVRQGQPQIGLQTLTRLLLKLAHFKLFAPECMHHPDRAQALLRLCQDSAFLFLNSCRFAANPVGKEINRAHNKRHNTKRNQRELPIQAQHNDESSDQGDDRSEDVGEALVVNCLN